MPATSYAPTACSLPTRKFDSRLPLQSPKVCQRQTVPQLRDGGSRNPYRRSDQGHRTQPGLLRRPQLNISTLAIDGHSLGSADQGNAFGPSRKLTSIPTRSGASAVEEWLDQPHIPRRGRSRSRSICFDDRMGPSQGLCRIRNRSCPRGRSRLRSTPKSPLDIDIVRRRSRSRRQDFIARRSLYEEHSYTGHRHGFPSSCRTVYTDTNSTGARAGHVHVSQPPLDVTIITLPCDRAYFEGRHRKLEPLRDYRYEGKASSY